MFFVPLIQAGISMIQGEEANKLTREGLDKQIAATREANQITNAQWSREFNENKRQFDVSAQMKDQQFLQNTLNNTPDLKKAMISIWGGGK